MQKHQIVKIVLVCFAFSLNKKTTAQTNLFFKNTAPISFFHSSAPFVLNSPIQDQVSCLQLGYNSKLPMFCRMEDKLHKRLNVWIKFRTGSDEFYRTLIALPRETKNKLID